MRVDGGLSRSEQLDLDRLELELRKLAPVVAVGFEGGSHDGPIDPEDVLTVQVQVTEPSARQVVEEQAVDLARLHHARPLRIVVFVEGEEPGSAAPPAPGLVVVSPSRVKLTSIVQGDGGHHVTLTHGDVSATGHSVPVSPTAAASATVSALRQLGWSIPFDVQSAVRLAVGEAGAVLVHLSGAEGERLGVSAAPVAEEAAVKATLQALNRWLDDPGRRPMTVRPTPEAR